MSSFLAVLLLLSSLARRAGRAVLPAVGAFARAAGQAARCLALVGVRTAHRHAHILSKINLDGLIVGAVVLKMELIGATAIVYAAYLSIRFAVRWVMAVCHHPELLAFAAVVLSTRSMLDIDLTHVQLAILLGTFLAFAAHVYRRVIRPMLRVWDREQPCMVTNKVIDALLLIRLYKVRTRLRKLSHFPPIG